MKTNEWQHLALVSNAGTLAIYYNGVSQTLNATSLVKPDNTIISNLDNNEEFNIL